MFIYIFIYTFTTAYSEESRRQNPHVSKAFTAANINFTVLLAHELVSLSKLPSMYTILRYVEELNGGPWSAYSLYLTTCLSAMELIIVETH
jgi:hypothetical protein